MTATMTLPENASWIEQEQDILPIITALFVDGLGPARNRHRDGEQWLSKASGTSATAKIFRLPITVDQVLPLPKKNQAADPKCDDATENIGNRAFFSAGGHTVVRTLICGISHHFNNLLMGIWGNASLIRMQLSPEDSRYARVEQMERLIQSGAFLIHMVLGYLGERRTVAKRIRLNQLISEIRSEIGFAVGDEDPWNFEARLKWASRIQRPRMIASSTARVLEVLFQCIENHCKEILAQSANDETIHKKLATIDTLVARGLDITCRLRLYSGDFSKHPKTRIKLGPIVNRLLKKFKSRYSNIRTHCRISSYQPAIHANQWQIEWALKEILTNAANAMPQGGSLILSVQTLQDEAPKERCGVQKGWNYLVITVQDSGGGVPTEIKKHIFEPFFASPNIRGRKGLGLAAADGILKNHSGYIHFQSSPKSGCTFKIYLPIS